MLMKQKLLIRYFNINIMKYEIMALSFKLKTTLIVPSINRQLSVISEKDEQVLPSENISTSSGGKPVVSNEAPSQTVYAPPTFQHLPPKQSTIVGTVPTTPIITQV